MSDSESSFSVSTPEAMPNDVIKKYILVAVLILFCVNTLILDVYLLTKKQPAPLATNLQQNNANPIATQTFACPQSCADLLRSTATASQSSQATSSSLITPTPTSTLTPTPTATITPTPTTKEFFIPLGAGLGNNVDWTTLTGVGASIDPANYGQITSTYFEVTARTPTGNEEVSIRLYNANTYQYVVNSDISFSGGTATILVSKPITLLQGKNLYQVQMKTQLRKDTYIDQARIRIVTK